jgi:hypothetical protein
MLRLRYVLRADLRRLSLRDVRRRPDSLLLMRKSSKSLALSGVITALNVIFLYIGSVISVLDYSFAALCGILMTFAIVELKSKYALMIYFSSSLLALLILPDKLSAILFVFFTGWYSFLKRFSEGRRPAAEWVIKIAVFNVVLSLIIFVTKKILIVENEKFYFDIFVYAIANICFLVYDLLLSRLITLYANKYSRHFKF